MTKCTFRNWSYKFFPGFYESILYSSDYEWNLAQSMAEDEGEDIKYELTDWDGFTNEVARKITGNVYEPLFIKDDGIIKSIEYNSIASPRFYNFETDKILLDMEIDQEKLEQYCFITNREVFHKYLYDNFTSYDGFHSFIANNVADFIIQYEDEGKKDRCLDLLIEFYWFNCLTDWDEENIRYDMQDIADEILWKYMERIDESKEKSE